MVRKALISFDANGNVADLNIIAETDEDVEIIRRAFGSVKRRSESGRLRKLLTDIKILISNGSLAIQLRRKLKPKQSGRKPISQQRSK